ncbi:phage portal protein [Acidocella sp.]|uniref:phage portal protein n=1 Tax=Acidocella sp. TaxID=50710 RepID=UPI00261E4C16|nr:phage portal protein [Acidocella sp.]
MVEILGADGIPLPRPKTPVGGGRQGPTPMALNGTMNTPFDAADNYSEQMEGWYPFLWSPDGETSQFWRDRIVSRARDLERNDGWARGGITRVLDNVIGADYRAISKPDYRALAYYTGIKGFDAVWADEFGRVVDACWRSWADDKVGHYCDAMHCLTLPQLFWVAMRHKLIDGDALGVMAWRDDVVGPGRARYATALQLIDPDRLSNPQLQFDANSMRGGVEVDQYGAPKGYWIRRAHVGDWFSAAKAQQWDYLPRQTTWGRPVVVHDYDHHRASQHHGAVGILTSVMQRMKMLTKYDSVELEAAIINAVFAAYMKSPFDPAMIEEAVNPGPMPGSLGPYQDMRNEFWTGKRLDIGGARVTTLAPGEEIGTVNASRPAANYEPFSVAVLRHIASGLGVTYEQLSGDFSRTNYSSFRGATNEVLKTFNRRAAGFESGFAMPVRAAFLEEVMDIEDIPLPAGAPSFEEFRTAYARCRWLRPGRGWVDPVAERQGAIIGMNAGLSSLEMEVGENTGEDWEEIVDQLALERRKFEQVGLPPLPIVAAMASVDNGGQAGRDAGDKPITPKPPGAGE